MEITSCPVCGSGASEHVFDVRDYVLSVSSDTFGVRQCGSCRAGYLSPRPSREEIGRYYPDAFYWSYEKAAEAPLDAKQLLGNRSAQIAAKLACLKNPVRGKLLDIGAMKGEFLHAARQLGWEVEGIEFIDRAPNVFGVPMRYGDFLEMDFAEASLDCVTMWAVLEHVYDPRNYVRKISRVLRKNGTFIGVVTNFHSIQARILRSDDFPRHLTMFTKRSLRVLLRESGLVPIRMWTDQRLFGGPMTGLLTFLTKRLLGYSVDEVLYEMRNQSDLEAFCCKFRGRNSVSMKFVSRCGRFGLWIPEKILDASGFGFNLIFEARKV